MTDRECLEKFVDLSDSDITETEKRNLYKLLHKYKEAFSLRDEIGLCQSMEVELELKDESPFFIRPFPIKESDKGIVDKEMRKGCLLGILKKGRTSSSSLIILIPRKLSGIPRIVTDFRHLNSRLVTLQTSIPLYQRLGMGLSVSPAIWQNFIQKVLQEIPDHRKIIWLSWMIVLCSLRRKFI